MGLSFSYPVTLLALCAITRNSVPSAASLLFTHSTLPDGLTASCASALTSNIPCSPVVKDLENGVYYPAATLNRTCTEACSSALDGYYNAVRLACGAEPWTGYYDAPLPVVMIADLLRYQYHQTCLTDSGRFCNLVAAQAAGVLGVRPSAGTLSLRFHTSADLRSRAD